MDSLGCHSLFFLLVVLLFLELYRSFTMYNGWGGVGGVVRMFNESAQSFFVWSSSLASAAGSAVLLSLLSGLYRVHGLRVSSLCHVDR